MTSAAIGSISHLPTGGCNFNFPNLGGISICGCQRFTLKKKKSQKRVNHWASGREIGNGMSGTSEDSEDDGDACRCGHDSCYHSGHPVVPTHAMISDSYRLQLSPQLREPLELQRNIGYGGAAARSQTARHVHGGVMMRPDGSANANATSLSAVSGTTTERDPSTSGTPAGIHKVSWTTKHAATVPRVRDETSKQLTDQLQNVVSHGMEGRLRVSQEIARRPPSSSPSAVKDRLKDLVAYTAAIGSDHLSMRERVEMMEVMPATLDDLAEKVDLMDDHVNEKLDSYEVRLKNEIDDRLGPIESFLKAYGEKRKRRHQVKPHHLEGYDNWNGSGGGGACGGKSRKRRDERDASEVTNNQQHGITTTSFTTTSFTTTTSSFGSPGPARTDPKVLSEIETLNARLLEIEASAPPSVARPWVIEVVLVPPAPLGGIWADAKASVPNTQYTGSEDASTSAHIIGKALCSPPSGLVPFSFSVKSKVYKRLLSRGFVKRLHITGPTAREVSLSIETNFQDALEFCASYNISCAPSRARSQQLRSQTSEQCTTSSSQCAARSGTRNLWEPLRKIYKQAALEFLPLSDITSPALWTVDFLKANCIMRGTTRKTLYIIPRTPSRPNASSVTWEAIKRLGRYYDDDETEREQATVEEEESFWQYDAKLDSNPNRDRDPDPDLRHTPGSFFSEPLASFGPFASEGASDSIGIVQAKMSFSSHLAPSPQVQQEATPPETAPQLRPRRLSKLNRIHKSPLLPVSVEGEEVVTEDDAERNPGPPRKKKKSPSGRSAAVQPPRTTVPPPSPPLTYPQGVRQRKKKTAAKKSEPSQSVRASPTADPSPPPPVASSSSGAKGFEETELRLGVRCSPSSEVSPSPPAANSSGSSVFGRSFKEFMTHGVEKWEDRGSGGLHQGWDHAGLDDSTNYGFRFSDVNASIDWEPSFGSAGHLGAVSEVMENRESVVAGEGKSKSVEMEEGDDEQTQEDIPQEGDEWQTQEDTPQGGDEWHTQDHGIQLEEDGGNGDREEKDN